MSVGKQGRNVECKAKENQKIMGHFQVKILYNWKHICFIITSPFFFFFWLVGQVVLFCFFPLECRFHSRNLLLAEDRHVRVKAPWLRSTNQMVSQCSPRGEPCLLWDSRDQLSARYSATGRIHFSLSDNVWWYHQLTQDTESTHKQVTETCVLFAFWTKRFHNQLLIMLFLSWDIENKCFYEEIITAFHYWSSSDRL